jgi:hypothetical protein
MKVQTMAAALIGVILLAIVFVTKELWLRFEPADPPRPDSTTNAFLEKRYRGTHNIRTENVANVLHA